MKTFRNFFFFCLLLLGAGALVLFPSESADAAREGLSVCFSSVLPSLFPFFVVSSLFIASGAASFLGRLLGPFMFSLFGVSGIGASALLLGLTGGYPVGAKTIGELYRSGQISQDEGEQLLCFCSNSGPGFFLGMCGANLFHSVRAGLYLYLVHVAAALLVGILLRRTIQSPLPARAKQRARTDFSPAAAFPAAVQSSFAAIWNVCGFVILFMVILHLIALLPPVQQLSALGRSVLFGFVEMTNGILLLSADRAGFIACAAIMGWGGLSVHAQTLSVLSGTPLRTRRYFLGKALQSLLSVPLAAAVAAHLF